MNNKEDDFDRYCLRKLNEGKASKGQGVLHAIQIGSERACMYLPKNLYRYDYDFITANRSAQEYLYNRFTKKINKPYLPMDVNLHWHLKKRLLSKIIHRQWSVFYQQFK
jgi:hypothetical protein